MQHNLKYAQEEPANQYYAYVTRDDLIDCFGDNVVLTLRNYHAYDSYRKPPENENDTFLYNLEVRSRTDIIDVRLATMNGESVHHIKAEPIDVPSDPLSMVEDISGEARHDMTEENYQLRRTRRKTKQQYRTQNFKLKDAIADADTCNEDVAERNAVAEILLRQSMPAEKRLRRDFDGKDIDERKYNISMEILLPSIYICNLNCKDLARNIYCI